MKIGIGVLLGSALVLMISCNGQPSPTENVDQYIDSSIVGVERIEIANFIRSLPLESRENVFLLPSEASGQIFVNKPSLRGVFGSSLSPSNSKDLVLQTHPRISTQAATIPSCKPQRDPYTNGAFLGGVFNTVISETGYKAAQMDIRLPAETDVLSGEQLVSTGDTPYIYFGGYGNGERSDYTTIDPYNPANNRIDPGSAVDFGLKHNRVTNEWRIFGNFQAYPGTSKLTFDALVPYAPDSARKTAFKAEDRLRMRFGVTAVGGSNYLALTVEALSGVQSRISVGRVAIGILRDWTPTAANMRIKRTVSIAQIIPASNKYGFAQSNAKLKNVFLSNFKRTTTSGQEASGWVSVGCKVPDNIGSGGFQFLPDENNSTAYVNPFYYPDLIPRLFINNNGEDRISLITNPAYLFPLSK